MSGPYDQNFIWVIHIKYIYSISCKGGCNDIYMVETSEISQFSTPQQSIRVTISNKQTNKQKVLKIIENK